MNWHKTNLALILILVIMDIFLLNMLTSALRDTKRLPEEMIREATDNLALSGISVSDTAIDKSIYSGTVYHYNTSIFFAEEMSANAEETHPAVMKALSFLTSGSGNPHKSVKFFDIPDGTSLSAINKDGNVIGSAQILGNTGFEFSISGLLTDDILETCKTLLLAPLYEYQPQSCPRVIKNFFYEIYGGDIGAKKLFSTPCGAGTVYLCCLSAGGRIIYDMPICFYIENGKILYANGNIFFNMPQKSHVSSLLDGINILYCIPSDIINEKLSVNYEKMCYHTVNIGTNESYIVPTWVINCNTAQKFTLIFNALTGDQLK